MKVTPHLLAAALSWSCLCHCTAAPLSAARLLRAGATAQAPVVVVLENKTSSLNSAVLDSFSEGVDARIVAFADITSLPPGRLAMAVRAEKPDLILALGPQAAQFTRDALPDLKSVFALVLNYRAQNLGSDAAPNMVGIAMENSLVSEFTQFKMVDPEMRRLIMPYCAGRSDAMVDEARRTLSTMGLRLEAVPMNTQDALPQIATLKHEPGDVLWLASDALILSNAPAFIAQSDQLRLPVFASVSGVLARAGAVAAIEVDIPSIGTQAADIATRLLRGEATLQEIGIQAPNGTQLVVNLTTAQRHGLTVPLRVMPFIGETITE